jgi:hypothetical protein
MSREANTNNHPDVSANETDDRALSRRNVLLGTSTLVAAATLTSGSAAGAGAKGRTGSGGDAAAGTIRGSVWPQAEHSHHLGRRCRRRQYQRLFERVDGL